MKRGTSLRTLGAGLLVVAVALLLSCAGSSDDRQQQALSELANQIEERGHLRPFFPSYIPNGLDAVNPEVKTEREEVVAVIFWPGSEAPSLTPRPALLLVGEEYAPAGVELSCKYDPQYEYSEPGILRECANVRGLVADLETVEQPDGVVDYGLSFEFDDRYVNLLLSWEEVDEGPTEELKRELLLVAESIVASR